MTKNLLTIVSLTLNYQWTLLQFIFLKKRYNEVTIRKVGLNGEEVEDRWGKVQLYSLSLIFRMWSHPHYRSPSFQQDMIDNLKNVAIPGTGVPLSVFCYNWWVALLFILIVNPIVCLLGAWNKASKKASPKEHSEEFSTYLAGFYRDHLMNPDDWFSFWRLNCRLASLHSLITKSEDYKQEDKWTFLTSGRDANVPVSPFLDMESIVLKNKNMEGGLGIHFFKNASHGGDWIIQERLKNADWLCALLPGESPLSTLRVITSSTWALHLTQAEIQAKYRSDELDGVTGTDSRPYNRGDVFPLLSRLPERTSTATTSAPDTQDSNFSTDSANDESSKAAAAADTAAADDYVVPPRRDEDEAAEYVKPLSALLRLGRAGAATDHASVLFDVDIVKDMGRIKGGTSNRHWYSLGLDKVFSCPWLPQESYSHHPDSPCPVVTGQVIPDMDKALDIVVRAHFELMRDVPMVGWDVAFTDKGVCLLEVNLSCNFFKGSFDVPAYINMVDSYWKVLDEALPH